MDKFSNIACCSVLVMGVVSATAFAGSVADDIMKRAATVSEFKGLLNSADENVRLAALDTLLKSENTATRAMAYTAGYASKDVTVRAITLRNNMNELSTVPITISLPESSDKDAKKYYEKYAGGGMYSMTVTSYEEKNGNFKFKDNNGSKAKLGSVSGLTLSFRGSYCNGNFVLNELSELVGSLKCSNFIYPAKILLR